MSPKWKARLLLIAAITVALVGVGLAVVFIVIPREQRKVADALLKAAAEKATALQAAAVLINKQAEVQVVQVDKRVETEKKLDVVDFANDFINSRVKS